MKRRVRILLMMMLTGIWLCVQSPFAHAQRMQLEAGQSLAVQSLAEEAPCHGEHAAPAVPVDSHVDEDGCCKAGHCDGHCATLSSTPVASSLQQFMRSTAWLSPFEAAGLRLMHQPEPFRPPI